MRRALAGQEAADYARVRGGKGQVQHRQHAGAGTALPGQLQQGVEQARAGVLEHDHLEAVGHVLEQAHYQGGACQRPVARVEQGQDDPRLLHEQLVGAADAVLRGLEVGQQGLAALAVAAPLRQLPGDQVQPLQPLPRGLLLLLGGLPALLQHALVQQPPVLGHQVVPLALQGLRDLGVH